MLTNPWVYAIVVVSLALAISFGRAIDRLDQNGRVAGEDRP